MPGEDVRLVKVQSVALFPGAAGCAADNVPLVSRELALRLGRPACHVRRNAPRLPRPVDRIRISDPAEVCDACFVRVLLRGKPNTVRIQRVPTLPLYACMVWFTDHVSNPTTRQGVAARVAV